MSPDLQLPLSLSLSLSLSDVIVVVTVTLDAKAAGLHDPDCTFKPKITARSANLQARSVVELSRGDQLKRETTQRLTRLRAEQVQTAVESMEEA